MSLQCTSWFVTWVRTDTAFTQSWWKMGLFHPIKHKWIILLIPCKNVVLGEGSLHLQSCNSVFFKMLLLRWGVRRCSVEFFIILFVTWARTATAWVVRGGNGECYEQNRPFWLIELFNIYNFQVFHRHFLSKRKSLGLFLENTQNPWHENSSPWKSLT